MIKIAHRGNFAGPNKERENTFNYISEALNEGYSVEVDIWKIDNKLYLGHDEPGEEIDLHHLKNTKFWCHSKSIETHFFLCSNNIHCFWHDRDNDIFTNYGIRWTKTTTSDGIIVMPESNEIFYNMIKQKQICPLGVCSDFVSEF